MAENERKRERQERQSPYSLDNPEETEKKSQFYCLCGLCHVRTGAIIIGISEILIVCHSLIFAFTNFDAGKEKYERYNPVFAAVIKYEYLLPFFIIQTCWILSNLVLLLGTKTLIASLLIPHILVQVIAILSGIAMVVACFVNITDAPSVNWELLASIIAFLTLILAEIYFAFVMWACYKFLKLMHVSVSAQKAWFAATQMTEDEIYSRKLITVTKKNVEHMRRAQQLMSHPGSAIGGNKGPPPTLKF